MWCPRSRSHIRPRSAPVVVFEVGAVVVKLAALPVLGLLGLGWRELVVWMRFLVVFAFYLCPPLELVTNWGVLFGPAHTAYPGHDLVVVLVRPCFGPLLIRLSIQHEGIHWSFDFPRVLSLFDLSPPLLDWPAYVGIDVGDGNVWICLLFTQGYFEVWQVL